MNITYKKDLMGSYMILEGRSGVTEEDFEVKMLSLNSIPGLMQFSTEMVDGRLEYIYNITSLHSFRRTFEREKPGGTELLSLLRSFREMCGALDDYMLEGNDILLEPDCIFTDGTREHFYFCCYPYFEGNILETLASFSNDLLSIIDYEDSQAVQLAFDLNRMVSSDGFSAADLDMLIRKEHLNAQPVRAVLREEEVYFPAEEERETEENLKASGAESLSFSGKVKSYFRGKSFFEIINDINDGGVVKRIRNYREDEPRRAEAPAQLLKQEVPQPAEYMPLSENTFFEEAPPDGAGETEELTRSSSGYHWLLPPGAGPGSRRDIMAYPFTIGSVKGSCDMRLESRKVSREHCRILKGTEGYEIEDLNSRNGTFLNGVSLAAYTPSPLRPGDLIRVADTELVFC